MPSPSQRCLNSVARSPERHGSQIWKQRAVPRQVAQDFRHVFIKAHDGNRAGLLARIADDVVFPINVLGVQARQIGLRCAQMPRQFVERLAFGIVLAGDDGQMFRQRDAALLFELDGGPLAFRHQRPRQPVHVHAEVVQPPEINIRRDGSHLQDFQNRFALAFDDDLRQAASPAPCPSRRFSSDADSLPVWCQSTTQWRSAMSAWSCHCPSLPDTPWRFAG